MAKRPPKAVVVTRDWQPGDIALCMAAGWLYGREVFIDGPLQYDLYSSDNGGIWGYPVKIDANDLDGHDLVVEPLDLEPHRFKEQPVSLSLIERLTEENTRLRWLTKNLKSTLQSAGLWAECFQREYDAAVGRKQK